MKAIGITRVSGEAQDKKYGPEAQEAEIRQRAKDTGAELLDVWHYQESATDGNKRPKFDALLQQLVALGENQERVASNP